MSHEASPPPDRAESRAKERRAADAESVGAAPGQPNPVETVEGS